MGMANSSLSFPARTGPAKGSFAFSPAGERQIYELFTSGVENEYSIAAQCGVTNTTVRSIVKRVQARIDAGDEPAVYDPEFYASPEEPKAVNW